MISIHNDIHVCDHFQNITIPVNDNYMYADRQHDITTLKKFYRVRMALVDNELARLGGEIKLAYDVREHF